MVAVVVLAAAAFSSGVAVARRASREAEHEASSGQLLLVMMMMMMMMHRDGGDDENEGLLLAAGLGGVFASCVTGYSLYTLKNTGCGLPAGPGGIVGAIGIPISALLDCRRERVREKTTGADYRLGRTRCSDWQKASRSCWHSPACTLASLKLSITGTSRTPSRSKEGSGRT